MHDELFDDLVDFIRNQAAFFEGPVTKETAIEDDLGITGDDGEELIIKFSKRYNVNIDNFYFNKYFYPEPFINEMPDKVELLTVGHLLKVITAGRLDDEIINS